MNKNYWIETYTGGKFHPFLPKGEEVNILISLMH